MAADLNFSEGWIIIQPLLIFIFGMVLYSFFIFSFYKHLARKDIFKLHLERYNTTKKPILKKFVRIFFYIMEHILLFPIFVLCWFAILTMLITLLSKNQVIDTIMLVSVALVGSVRVAAYLTEDLSNDLAKMLPFALLGVFLIDINYVSLSRSYGMISQVPSMWNIVVYYLIFMIVLELALRAVYESFRYLFRKSSKDNSKNAEGA